MILPISRRAGMWEMTFIWMRPDSGRCSSPATSVLRRSLTQRKPGCSASICPGSSIPQCSVAPALRTAGTNFCSLMPMLP